MGTSISRNPIGSNLGYDTSLPRDASPAEVARLTGEMLSRETGHLPQQVQFTQIEKGPVYYFVATCEGPA
jgi:hypothetical protein